MGGKVATELGKQLSQACGSDSRTKKDRIQLCFPDLLHECRSYLSFCDGLSLHIGGKQLLIEEPKLLDTCLQEAWIVQAIFTDSTVLPPDVFVPVEGDAITCA